MKKYIFDEETKKYHLELDFLQAQVLRDLLAQRQGEYMMIDYIKAPPLREMMHHITGLTPQYIDGLMYQVENLLSK
jgi:arsenate reductase-like glutaredoxin family protein